MVSSLLLVDGIVSLRLDGMTASLLLMDGMVALLLLVDGMVAEDNYKWTFHKLEHARYCKHAEVNQTSKSFNEVTSGYNYEDQIAP